MSNNNYEFDIHMNVHNVDNHANICFEITHSDIDEAKRIMKLMADTIPDKKCSCHCDKTETKTLNSVTDNTSKRDPNDFLVRNRLPNVIDPNTLKVSSANTEKSSIACPHCKQSSFAIIAIDTKPKLFFREYFSNEFSLCKTPDDYSIDKLMYDSDSDSIKEYYNSLRNIEKIDTDIAVDDYTGVFCPICHQEESFGDWKQAAMDVKDTHEELCPICGSDDIMSSPKGDDNVEKECESCNFKWQ